MSSRISSTVRPPAVGGQSPWRAIDGVERISDNVVIVFTASHGGAWLSPSAQARMPASIEPMHGRSWWEEDCEILAVLVTFGIHDRLDRSTAIGALARWYPGWLDALAPAHELPTAAQVARIRKLWTDFAVEGAPDFTAFPREVGTGMVHGCIGNKIFVGVEPDGRAHS